MRTAVRLTAIILLGLVACIEPMTSPALDGGLAIVVPASSTPLDSGHVVLTGPTNKTVTATPGQSVTITSLSPGNYTVALEGFQGGGVAYFTQVTGVTVSAGQNTTATIPSFPAFSAPTIVSIPSITVTGQVPVIYSSVTSSNGYVVQRDTLATFATSHDTTVAAGDTSVVLTIPLKAYKVRVRALDPYGMASPPSAVAAVAAIASLTVTPSTATVTPVAPSDTQRFTAAAKDASGNPVSGVTFLWVSSNPNVAIVDQAGLATGLSGGTTTISAAGLGVPGSATLTVTGGTAKSLVFTTQPANATAGAALSPAIQVEIRDTNNVLVATARNPVTIAIQTGPGPIFGTTTVSAINGVASFSGVNVRKAGSGYTLSATSSGLASATSASFVISSAAATSLAFTTQPPTSAEGNVAMAPALAVTVLDTYGNVVTGSSASVTVSLLANPWATVFGKGGTLSGTTTQAASSGVATFNDLSVDRPATGYTLQAAAAGLTSGTSNPFNVHLTIQSIAAGGYHTCAIATGGTYCWGTNYYGELGRTPGYTSTDSVPVLVSGGFTFTQVAVGGYHSCALTSTNVAYCWGNNGNGQLGNGTTGSNPDTIPGAVTGGLKFTQLDLGDEHTCGKATSGIVYCWGYNYYGQIGNGNNTQQTAPVQWSGGATNDSLVSAGGLHTCAITTAGTSNALCWGYNGYGQLGDNTTANTNAPVAVTPAFAWAAVTAGEYTTCGVLKSSGVSGNGQCWGFGGQGQLGNGTVPQKDSVPAYISGSVTWSSLTAGYYHVCGIASSPVKGAYCWGYDVDGELGDNAAGRDSVPVAVTTTLIGTNIAAITAGSFHTCALVGTSVYCWGQGGSGQLGTGQSSNKPTPTQIIQ